MATTALSAMAFVLLLSGLAKLGAGGLSPLRRAGRATLGVLEIAVAALAIAGPGRVAAAVLTATFAGFAIVHIRRPEADCGCLGAATRTSRAGAALLTGATAGVAALLVIFPGHSFLAQLGREPLQAAATLAVALALTLAWRRLFTLSPGALARASDGLVDGAAGFLERRVSRRDALVRVAVAGSALAVAPLRYLLYPVSALAAIVPGDCSSGLCTDGYTAFCCEINQGRNTCPEGTFAGGWWKCTDYSGRRLCREAGVRYYVDCNRIPGTHFPGGCHCANDTCAHRRVACNVFRYGQCNPHVHGVTEVVCRMVLCENPSRIEHLNCSASLAVDDAVCGHDAPCLEPPALELSGAGGV